MTEMIYTEDSFLLQKNNSDKPDKLSFENIAEANKVLDLNFDEQDVAFYSSFFKDKLKRNPTEMELLDLAQSNSEHSRHWVFKGKMIHPSLGVLPNSLFKMVKSTLSELEQNNRSNRSVLAFCDNSSAIKGFDVSTIIVDINNRNIYKNFKSKHHITFTAETHNFPTGVAPFQGATTGTGGRIRDNQSIGRGGLTIAGTAGYCVGEIDKLLSKYSEKNLFTLLKASDGASDYGNKFGEPLINGFCRVFGFTFNNKHIEWVKPIMFSGGIGQMLDCHKEKIQPAPGMLVVKIGGPGYKIGIGGGAASSRDQDTKNVISDLNAVQRGDAEMENKLNRVVRTCIEMELGNPILSIHDQGSGGTGNVTKEIVYNETLRCGAKIYLSKIPLGDDTMTDTDIWISEYQEQNTILIHPYHKDMIGFICKRENLFWAVIGEINSSGRIEVYSKTNDKDLCLDLPLEDILGNSIPQKTYRLQPYPKLELPQSPQSPQLPQSPQSPQSPQKREYLDSPQVILSMESVGSKRFLTSKVDRSVTGLIAQQQCVGPFHTPISDYAVVAQSHFGLTGGVTAIGERPLNGLFSPRAMAGMAVGEMLTNMVFAQITSLHDIRCSGNWMWPLKEEGENLALYEACDELCRICKEIGIAIDGGKDSLSMIYKKNDETICGPRQIVLSGYAPMPDIRKKITPNFKFPGTAIVFIDLALNQTRLGCSEYQHKTQLFSEDVPTLMDPQLVADVFTLLNSEIGNGFIFSGHDRSDGGLFTTITEMAIAGNLGAIIQKHSSTNFDEYWFNEELGIVLEIDSDYVTSFITTFNSSIGVECAYLLGYTTSNEDENDNILQFDDKQYNLSDLRMLWEQPSINFEKMQCNLECAIEEENVMESWTPSTTIINLPSPLIDINIIGGAKHKVAIIREEGSNGDREMASAFHYANFEVYDICMNDLIRDNNITLSTFKGIVFVGGFSYSDVGGSARGWYQVIKNNERVNKEFNDFYCRDDTFSLGVCNGCQLMTQLGWVGKCSLTHNKSGRFESRFPQVKVNKCNSILLQNFDDSILSIWTAHGEGQFVFESESDCNIVMQYVDPNGQPTLVYPYNPNGSPLAAAAVCSDNGRHLAMMPHPERCFLTWQMPYTNGLNDINSDKFSTFSPWFGMFCNARKFCDV